MEQDFAEVAGQFAAILKRHGLDSFQPGFGRPSARFLTAEPGGVKAADAPAIYSASARVLEGAIYAVAKTDRGKKLLVIGRQGSVPSEFTRASVSSARASGIEYAACDLSWDTFRLLRSRFPFVAPVSLRDRMTTIGTGDRLGLATPGHVMAVDGTDVAPVLAQQSIRELTLTNRTYEQVVADSAFGVFQEGYEGGYGADGDHLKTLADIDVALAAGMPMITLDLTEVMDPSPSGWASSEIESRYGTLDGEIRRIVDERYADKSYEVEGETIHIGREEAARCALMYWRALDFAAQVDTHLRNHRGDDYDLEISIDETTAPTLPSHHLFIALELKRRGVTVNSLAPRFIGEFQKGIDYIGELEEFEKQFITHCRIARTFGDYKVSIHSGSDKFRVYPAIGRHTNMHVHVKTAGTSWLEAIRTVATVDPELYRHMHAKAFEYFEDATKLYHITADLGRIPALDRVSDEGLPEYLERDESRQLIHITYGGLLNDETVRGPFFAFLASHEAEHYAAVRSHIRRHLSELGVPTTA